MPTKWPRTRFADEPDEPSATDPESPCCIVGWDANCQQFSHCLVASPSCASAAVTEPERRTGALVRPYTSTVITWCGGVGTGWVPECVIAPIVSWLSSSRTIA